MLRRPVTTMAISLALLGGLAASRADDATTETFPTFNGVNLDHELLVLPTDFRFELTLVIVMTDAAQNPTLEEWAKNAPKLNRQFDQMGIASIMLVDPDADAPPVYRGERSGLFYTRDIIRSLTQRQRRAVFKLFGNKPDFFASMEMADPEHPPLFLVDREGSVLWRGYGGPRDELADEIRPIIKNYETTPRASAKPTAP